MFQTYKEAIEWIHARLRLGMKPGLSRMEWMMEKLNHPERRIKTVHIGGTNGKGSTVTYLRSILQEGGFKVGTFTSPYFEQFNERISVNGQPISDEEIVQLTNVIKPLSDELEKTDLGAPTEFEVITAMSFYYYAFVNPVDIVLYEVGLGGRLDSTNIIHPLLSIITSIGLDHTNILGESYAEIAYEKAGIIKNGVGLITAVKQPEALEVIRNQAREKKSAMYLLGEQFSVNNHHSLTGGESFNFQSIFQAFDELEISMIGEHQVENASLAVMATLLLNKYYSFMVEEEQIKAGLKKAYWPGRFEVMSESPLVVIDGAHNEEGITTLVNELEKRYSNKKKNIIFTALSDKKLDKIIMKLDQVADKITFVEFDYPRASRAEDLFSMSQSPNKHLGKDWKSELEQQLTQLDEEEMLVITGSLYFLSEVKPSLLNLLNKAFF
ncbi:folylpolyglutamate synthase/dihydrofolate synthase family protein (plasmid) [Bacillus sp. 31A1R]|uniref:tetrahydrofolate synthase n=1 Tax=Robertmurraya mangrovi TaxID=3098077 RepID=A0ABU5IUH4_9BACI|nr:folylpolyglutamate synthase/dihydrofolate synthase family protein [Bacillus sp. 31A1R]MDZ5470794.1 folylpolyglutamate synthase/dihydrofolate synthase family protein [Bacillus sp. 31A1R]